jgi:uncharacterized membrane protein
MNRTAANLVTGLERERHAGDLDRLARLLLLVLLAAGLSGHGLLAHAAPRIEVGFEADATDNQKLVHAVAVFDAPQPLVYEVFNRITSYPTLHDWIRNATLVRESNDTQEFLVEFSFPWPVGLQWSRVEVHHSGNTIYWKQAEGSLRANHGSISFTTTDNEVHIDYRAAIDIGLPELCTRAYKKKFITEFLNAAYKQSRSSGSAAALALATGP